MFLDIVDVLPSDIKKEVGSSDPVMFPKLEDGLMSTFPSILVPFKLEFDFRESGSISITDQGKNFRVGHHSQQSA